MNKPLEGIKVIELSNYVAAPGCARMLADMGADVIKIEAFGGDAWRETGKSMIHHGDEENPVYEIYNVGKRSICINAKEEKGHELIMKMLETADVFISNTRLKSLKKLGFDPETLAEKFPKLVIATLDGYGEKGPDANTPGFDTMAFWSRSGFLRDMAVKESPFPVGLPTSIGDCVAGVVLAMEIVTALYRRERTGKGGAVKTTLYGTAIWVMSTMILEEQERYGQIYPLSHYNIAPITSQFQCKDGEWCTLVVLDYAKQAPRAYKALGIEKEVEKLGVVDYSSMYKNKREMLKLMTDAFLTRTADEWTQLFRERDVVAGKMPHFCDVTKDEQAWANGFLEDYEFRTGDRAVLPVPPLMISDWERTPSHWADLPGEHTDDVLREYGYDEEAIAELHSRGAVE